MKNVVLILIALVVALISNGSAQNSITMWQMDSSHTGTNPNETILTPDTIVSPGNFGLLFTQALDGTSYGQPVVLAGVNIGGTTHNVVFIATEHDSLYAFDADSNTGTNAAPLWKDSFIQTGVTTSVPQPVVGSGDISDEIGITTTPVIDPTTNTIYVVSKIARTADTTYHQYLHALDVATGAEKFGGPVEINPTFAGGANYNGTEQTTPGVVPFSALHENVRSGLALYNGIVYMQFASHADTQPYHGEILGYNASTLALTKKFITTPNGNEGGLWGGGASPAFDTSGNLFVAVGNGSYDHVASPYTADADWGESILKLSTTGTFDVTLSNTLNWFTPGIFQHLNDNDLDLGSSGLLLLPDQASGPHTHILVGGGKGGVMYVVDRDNLSGLTTPDGSIQQFSTPSGQFLFVTPAYFNGRIYYASSGGPIEERTVGYDPTTGNYISPTSLKSPQFYYGKGAGCFITANGTANGILWVLSGNGLQAYNANDVSQGPLATVASTTQDNTVTQNTKFAVPSAVNGKVYFTGYKEVGGGGRSQGYLFVSGVFPSASGTPAAPSNAVASPISASQISISWADAPNNNETGFVINRANAAAGPFTQIGTTSSGVTTYADTNLGGNRTYYYQVLAQNANGLSTASNVTSTTTFPTYYAKGLVAYWPLDDSSTSGTATDASGNGLTGTVNGEAVFADGLINNGIELHGTGFATSNISVPNSPALQFAATASFTLSAWVLPDDVDGAEQAIIAKSADQGNRYGLYINTAGNFVARGPAGDLVGSAASTSVWTHVTLVQDGTAGTRSLYINGVLSATGTAQAADGAGPFWIGQQKISATPDSFPGVIDEVRVYNRALAASEVTTLLSSPVLEAASVVTQGGTSYPLVISPAATLIAEPRQGSPIGQYNLVLHFSAAVANLSGTLTTQTGAAAVGSVSSISYDSTGSVVTVVLSGVASDQALNVHLTGFAGTGGTADVPFDVLVGDVNTDNVIDYLDAAIVANNQLPTVNSTNFLYDINCDGAITPADSALINASMGTTLGTELDANMALFQPSSDLTVMSPNASPFAFDNLGNGLTRWESAWGVDPQWVDVDLGSISTIHSVVLNWENAAGQNYLVQSSTDNINWTTLATVVGNASSGPHTYAGLNSSARFVRMYGTSRDTVYGYSLWEFQVNGIPGSINANPAPSITGNLSFTATQGSGVTYSVNASNTPTGFTASNLPAGLSINTTTGVISGTPTGSGSFTAYVSASNGKGTSAITPLAIVIAGTSAAPAISSPTTATGTVGSAFSYTITATNTPTSFAATGLPAGLSVNTATGVISGTPTTAGGPTSVAISAQNASGTGTGAVAITIGATQVATPVINSATTASGTVGIAFNYTISATNTPTSFAATGLPAGLSINTTTGVISGTPTTAGGPSTVAISATNSGGTGTGTVAVTIAQAQPVVNSATTASGTVGSAFSYTISATNTPTSFAATGLPAGLTINTTTGVISGTPTTAGGPSTVAISATNSGGTGTGTVAVTIAQAQPVINSATTASGTVGSAFSYTISATNNPTSFAATGLPAGLSINTTTGVISGTPTAAGGPSTVAISASNSGGTGTGTVAVTIAQAQPVINSATTASGTVGSAFNYTISATNTPTSFAATSLPAGLTVNTTTGVISGTPTTVGGPSTVAISATNSGGTGTGTVAVTIAAAPVNAPVINSAATASGTVGIPGSYTITATNNPTSFAATGLPAGLTVNTATGVISGTPTTAGASTVSISATNSGGTGTGTVAVTIAQAQPVINSATTASGTVGSAFTYTITATNTPTSFAATGLPAGLSINTTTGVISGTPTTAGGPSAVTISATNSGGTGTGTVAITIAAAPVNAPVINSSTAASGTVGSAFSYTITATNTPTSYGATGLPAGLTVNTATGVISGTPTTAGGPSTVTISAVNSGGTGTSTVAITIAGTQAVTPVINSAATASGNVGIAFSYAITAANNPTSYGATGLPAGLSINSGTGVISGTPTTVGGPSTVTISATNSVGTGTGTVAITLAAKPSKPAIVSGTIKSGTVGTPFSYQISAINSPTSFNATNLPGGLVINTTTGLISGTPTTAGGPTAVTLSATNSGGTGTTTLSVSIAAATGTKPVVNSSTSASGTVGTAFSYTITATNGATSFAATGLPAGLGVNATTGVISGTPTTAGGPTTVTLSATNSTGTGTGTVLITIAAAQVAPVINSATTASGTVGSAFSYTISATNTPTSFTATGLPAGLGVNTSTGVISGTPTTTGGPTTVTISATNAVGTGTGSVAITIATVPAVAPVINGATTASGAVGAAFSYTITATNSPASYAATGLPAGLNVNASTGVISGTPTTAGGPSAVTISATNLAGTGTGSVAITIAAKLSKPAIVSGTIKSGTVGTAFNYQINAINGPVSYNATGLPAGLSVNTATGLVSGTPTTAGGPTAVPISATNSAGTGTTTLNITINASSP